MYVNTSSRLSYASIAALNLKKKKADGISEPQSPDSETLTFVPFESVLIARAKATDFLARRRSVMPENSALIPPPFRPSSTRPAPGQVQEGSDHSEDNAPPSKPSSAKADDKEHVRCIPESKSPSKIDTVLTRPEVRDLIDSSKKHEALRTYAKLYQAITKCPLLDGERTRQPLSFLPKDFVPETYCHEDLLLMRARFHCAVFNGIEDRFCDCCETRSREAARLRLEAIEVAIMVYQEYQLKNHNVQISYACALFHCKEFLATYNIDLSEVERELEKATTAQIRVLAAAEGKGLATERHAEDQTRDKAPAVKQMLFSAAKTQAAGDEETDSGFGSDSSQNTSKHGAPPFGATPADRPDNSEVTKDLINGCSNGKADRDKQCMRKQRKQQEAPRKPISILKRPAVIPATPFEDTKDLGILATCPRSDDSQEPGSFTAEEAESHFPSCDLSSARKIDPNPDRVLDAASEETLQAIDTSKIRSILRPDRQTRPVNDQVNPTGDQAEHHSGVTIKKLKTARKRQAIRKSKLTSYELIVKSPNSSDGKFTEPYTEFLGQMQFKEKTEHDFPAVDGRLSRYGCVAEIPQENFMMGAEVQARLRSYRQSGISLMQVRAQVEKLGADDSSTWDSDSELRCLQIFLAEIEAEQIRRTSLIFSIPELNQQRCHGVNRYRANLALGKITPAEFVKEALNFRGSSREESAAHFRQAVLALFDHTQMQFDECLQIVPDERVAQLDQLKNKLNRHGGKLDLKQHRKAGQGFRQVFDNIAEMRRQEVLHAQLQQHSHLQKMHELCEVSMLYPAYYDEDGDACTPFSSNQFSQRSLSNDCPAAVMDFPNNDAHIMRASARNDSISSTTETTATDSTLSSS